MLCYVRAALVLAALHVAQAQADPAAEPAAEPVPPLQPTCEMVLDCGAIIDTDGCTPGTDCGRDRCNQATGSTGGCSWQPPCTKKDPKTGNYLTKAEGGVLEAGCDPKQQPVPPDCTGGAAPVCVGLGDWLKKATDPDDPAVKSASDCGCDYENACLEQVDCHWTGVVLEVILFVYCFAGLAIVCDDHLVVSLETLCVRWEVREDIAGASFMAFGSAAPEIIVNAVSTIKAAGKHSDDMTPADIAAAGQATSLGVGAIIGSGIIAFSLIPGTCGIFAGQTLFLKRRPLLRDVTTYTTALTCLVFFIDDSEISKFEACVLFSIYFLYLIILATAPKCRKQYKEQQAASPATMYERFLDEDDDMSTAKLGRTRSFVLEVQAEQAEQAKKEMRQLVEETFTEDEIFGMRRAFALFDTGDGKVARADVWRVLQVLGEEEHSAEDGEKTIEKVECEDDFSVDFMEFCAAMAKRGEEESLGEQIAEVMFKPLDLAFHYTCPPCEVSSDSAHATANLSCPFHFTDRSIWYAGAWSSAVWRAVGVVVSGHVRDCVHVGFVLLYDRVGGGDAMGSPAAGPHGFLWPRGRGHRSGDPGHYSECDRREKGLRQHGCQQRSRQPNLQHLCWSR